MFELHKTHVQNSILKDVGSTSTVTIPHVAAQENKWKECNLAHHTGNTRARRRNRTRSSPWRPGVSSSEPDRSERSQREDNSSRRTSDRDNVPQGWGEGGHELKSR